MDSSPHPPPKSKEDRRQSVTKEGKRILVSSTHKRYLMAPSEDRTLLSREELFRINRTVASTSFLATNLADTIPKLPFKGLSTNCDAVLKLRVEPFPARTCPLVSSLRFTPPEDFHIPPLEGSPRGLPLARSVISLLRGAECFPISLETHRKPLLDGNNDPQQPIKLISNTNPNQTGICDAKDIEMRARAALRAGNKPHAGRLLCSLGTIYYNYGNLEKAAEHFTAALGLFEAVDDPRGVAFCNNTLGVYYFQLGEYKTALIYHKQQEPLGGPYTRAVAEINLAVNYIALGELASAERALRDALANARAAKEKMLETITLGNLGVVSLRAGNMHAAQSNLEQALEQCSLVGDKSGAAVCLLLLGEIYLSIHDHFHALFYFEHTLRLGGEAGIPDIVAVARVNIGITKGNAAMRDCVARHARAMGHEMDVETIISVLPR